MISKKEIIKTGLILFIITAVAALLLAVVNKITSPVIAKNEWARTQEAMKVVMPDAHSFNEIEAELPSGIVQAFDAVDSAGEKIGMCVVSSSNGYGGEIQVLVGINSDATVSGVQIMSHSETPGLGANAAKPEFYSQYEGKRSGVTAVKNNPDENEIQAMSGATITSNAVTEAVSDALNFAGKGE